VTDKDIYTNNPATFSPEGTLRYIELINPMQILPHPTFRTPMSGQLKAAPNEERSFVRKVNCHGPPLYLASFYL
jgi:hypothetical protein